jgi:ATP-dependent helicase YprA (DUF1998 family)
MTLAGGSGVCAQLWRHIFCPSCSNDNGYVGGCPACIQVGECLKFNDFLCRKSAFVIGDHLLKRLQKTDVYKTNIDCLDRKRSNCSQMSSPRRNRRQEALRAAKDLKSAQRRQTVVGRPSWPMDHSDGT